MPKSELRVRQVARYVVTHFSDGSVVQIGEYPNKGAAEVVAKSLARSTPDAVYRPEDGEPLFSAYAYTHGQIVALQEFMASPAYPGRFSSLTVDIEVLATGSAPIRGSAAIKSKLQSAGLAR